MHAYPRQITLRARDVGCDRGGAAIVRGVDLTVSPGEAVQLFGANGAGKTTLLNLFAGHLRTAEGEVSWRIGEGEWTPSRPAQSILFITHAAPMKPALTALENLFFWARSYAIPAQQEKETVHGALEHVGMSAYADLRAGKLSAGQRRRLDIARAILARREIWLMDEPAAAIDAKGAEMVGAVIAEHLAAGGIAIAATHDTLGVASRKLVIG
ncbi:MAG: heme ABC exporter ATP-binding protein CcmA [Pseudomonadota bacterium]